MAMPLGDISTWLFGESSSAGVGGNRLQHHTSLPRSKIRGFTMALVLYGIRNCDTMKKARKWLDDRALRYEFHDYKVAGIDVSRLEDWCAKVGWETLLNRSGTTFRKLPDADRGDLDQSKA